MRLWNYTVWGRDIRAHAEALGLPIPGTGKHGGYRWYRHMATTAERRATEAARVDGLPYRPARLRLPSVWSDVPRHVERSWKAHRQTQYKAAA